MMWFVMIFVVVAGGYIGVAYDRYSRRSDPPPRPPRSYKGLHVIEDEWHTPDVKIRKKDD